MLEPDRQQSNRPYPNSMSENPPALFRDLSKYTDSVIQTSNLIFRRDLAKEKADKQQRQKEKWHRQSHAFIALAEDHDRASENAVAIEESSNRKIKQNSEAQEKALWNLVTSLADKTGGPLSGSEDDSSAGREIERLKAEVNGIKTDFDNLRYEPRKTSIETSLLPEFENRLRELTADSVPKSAIAEYERKVAQLTVNQSIHQGSLNEHEQHIAQLLEMRGLVDKVNALELGFGEAREKDFKLTETMVQQKNKAESLGEDLAVQKRNFELLSTKITHLENGLVDYNGEAEKRDENLSKSLEGLQRELIDSKTRTQRLEGDMTTLASGKSDSEPDISQQKSELQAFNERLQKLETSVSTLMSRGLNTQSALPAPHADLITLQTRTVERFNDFEARLQNLEGEQAQRDDLVIQEMERIAQEVEQIHKEVERITKEIERVGSLETSMENLNEKMLLIQSQAISVSNTKPPTPPPPPPPPPPPQADSHEKLEEFVRLKTEDVEKSVQQFQESLTRRIEPTEVLVESHQLRFDNLTTERLAAGMMDQMRSIYPPHPANILHDLNEIKTKQMAADRTLYGLWADQGKLKERTDSHSAVMATFQNYIGEIEKRVEEVRQVEGRVDGKLSNLSKTLQESHQALEQRLSESTLVSVEDVDSVRRKLAETTDGHQNLRAVCQDLRKDIEVNDKTFKSFREDIEANDKPFKSFREDSEANNKTFKSLREDIEANSKTIKSLREDLDVNDQFSKTLRKDIEANDKIFQTFREKVETCIQTIKSHREDFLTLQANPMSTALPNEMKAIKSRLQGVEDQVASLTKEVKAMKEQLQGAEEQFVKEFASMHYQVSTLNQMANISNMASEPNSPELNTPREFDPTANDSESYFRQTPPVKSVINEGSSENPTVFGPRHRDSTNPLKGMPPARPFIQVGSSEKVNKRKKPNPASDPHLFNPDLPDHRHHSEQVPPATDLRSSEKVSKRKKPIDPFASSDSDNSPQMPPRKAVNHGDKDNPGGRPIRTPKPNRRYQQP